MAKRKYDNPSIVEAVCLIRFEPSEPWDSTLIGRFYETLAGAFPKKRETHRLASRVKTSEARLSLELEDVDRGMLFKSDDETKIVQIMKNAVGANWLSPYGGWDKFKEMIRSVFEKYVGIAKPVRIEKFGLRYIDRWDFSAERFQFHDYFEISEFVPAVVSSSDGYEFSIAVQSSNSNKRIVKMKSSADDSQKQSVWLDIDCIRESSMDCDVDQFMHELDKSHDWIISTFETCLKDKLRKEVMELRSK